MTNQNNKPTSDPMNPGLSYSDLVSLYSQQWEQIRHLDSLDFRVMTLLPVVVGILTLGTNLLDNSNQEISKSVFLVVAIIVGFISFAGCYTTFRNWLCYMRRFAILNNLEREMGMVTRNIIKESCQFTFSEGYLNFNWKFVQSIRFPLTVFYSILGGCSYIIYVRNITCISIVIGMDLALIIFFYCNLITYHSYSKEFSSIQQTIGR